MLVLHDVTLYFGSRTILDSLQWQLRPSEKVALIGANGTGKSTLLKVLAGLQGIDEGQISKPNQYTIGYLPQEGLSYSGSTLFEEVRSVQAELLAMQDEIKELEEKLTEVTGEEQEKAIERLDVLHEEFRRRDGYKMDADVGHIIEGLGFTPDVWEKPCEEFSGGWQMRIALAKLLLQKPDVLLLDEPTNHLDIQARLWLQQYLKQIESSIILVSHDRYFLDSVISKCVEIYQGKLTIYDGNYSYFEVERERRYEALADAKKRQDEEIKRVEDFIERFRYKASKATQVQSRVKQLEKMERIVLPPLPPKSMKFAFPEVERVGKIPLRLIQASKSYGENEVLKNIDFHVERGEKVVLIGVNGAGKSTLMKVLVELVEYEGTREEGHNLQLGYFAQDQSKELNPKHTVLQSLEEVTPFESIPRVRNILGSFLFQGEDVDKKVSVLSGGERNRLALSRLLVNPANVLLLDEPTNHLDIQAKEVLLHSLKSFQGTLIIVSHDRYFINEIATRVVEVKNHKVESYPGNFRDYLETKAARGESDTAVQNISWSTASKNAPDQQKDPVPTSSLGSSSKVKKDKSSDYFEKQQVKREKDKQLRRLTKELEKVEASLEELEGKVEEYEKQMAADGFYDDFEAANQVLAVYQTCKNEVAEKYERWEELSEEMSLLQDA